MFHSIKFKIITINYLLMVLLVCGLGFFSYRVMLGGIEQIEQESIGSLLRSLSSAFSHKVTMRYSDIRLIASSTEFEAYAERYWDKALAAYFINYRSEMPILSYLNEDGYEEVKVVGGQQSFDLKYFGDEAFFQDALLNQNKVTLSVEGPDAELDEPSLRFLIARRGYLGDVFLGVLMGRVPIRIVADDVVGARIGRSGTVSLIDRQGLVLAHADKGRVGKKLLWRGDEAGRDIDNALSLKTGFARGIIYGIDSYIGYAPVEGFPFSLVASLPYSEFREKPLSIAKVAFVALALTLLLGWFLLRGLTSSIVSPLLKLVSATNDIGEGGLQQQLQIESRDEVGSLVASFNRMLLRLKKSQEKLVAATDYNESIVSSMSEGLFVIAEDGKTVNEVNNSLCRLLGYEKAEMVGERVSAFFVENEEGGKTSIEGLLGAENFPLEEWELQTKDGREVPVIVSGARLINRQGMNLGSVCVITDITSRKEEEEKLWKAEIQLRQAQKMEAIGTLAGGIAHDFNNILSAIQGYARLVADELPQDSQIRNDQEEVIKASERAVALVRQILTFRRQSVPEDERQPLMIHLVVKEAVKLLRASLPTTIEIKQDIDPECGLVLADPTPIHQIIMNLSTNAYHAMQETGGILAISVKPVEIDAYAHEMSHGVKPGRYLRIEVSDSGPGIDSETMAKIYEPYFTTKKHGDGTGLGLSIVLGIVQSHGGHITAYSEPGRGATFHVYFPLLESAKAPGDEEIHKPFPRGTERIMIIDDEDAIIQLEGRMLTSLGYQVSAFSSGEEALQSFLAQPDNFDLVITDMTMPDITGDQLAREILRVRPKMPIILCTGYSALIDDDKAKKIGIREFVAKPLSKQIMARVVRKALDGK